MVPEPGLDTRRVFIRTPEAAGRADALVTGNLSRFPALPPLLVPVLSPAGFLTLYRERLANHR